jgi:diguanylate cyclase (GGDEF)-like protein
MPIRALRGRAHRPEIHNGGRVRQMAQGIEINTVGSDRSTTATVEVVRQSIDAKAGTHVCVSPFPHRENATDSGRSSAYLIMVSGDIPCTMFRLSERAATFGRAPECTHQVHDITVSRFHAVFTLDTCGEVYVGDDASTNGTFVNGARLAAHMPVLLQDGDRIQLGTTVTLKLVRLEPHDEEFQRELFERTVRDALTGLYNRGYFLNQIRAVSDRNATRGLGLAVTMLDVDNFKNVNDRYGHFAGDMVLKEVAAVLRETTRSEDLVARYGGEEFVIALPVASLETAAARAEQIRTSLASRQIRAGGEEICVTASLGVAFTPPKRARNEHALIVRADRALYQAKFQGRNRVILTEPIHFDSSQTESSDSLSVV